MRNLKSAHSYFKKKNCENDFALYRTEVVDSLIMKYSTSTYDYLQSVIDC